MARDAMAFLQSEAASIEAGFYEIVYEDIQYERLGIPLASTGHPWAPSIEYYTADSVTDAKLTANLSGDIPEVAHREDVEYVVVQNIANKWTITKMEAEQAMLLGRNISDKKMRDSRRGIEEKTDKIVKSGMAGLGWDPFFLEDGAGKRISPANKNVGTYADTWADDAQTQAGQTKIFKAWSDALKAIWVNSKGRYHATQCILPHGTMIELEKYPIIVQGGGTSAMTVAEWLRSRSANGEGAPGPQIIETTWTDSDALFYVNDSDVLRMHMPMPLMTTSYMMRGGFEMHTEAWRRFGGLEWRLPEIASYKLKGIA